MARILSAETGLYIFQLPQTMSPSAPSAKEFFPLAFLIASADLWYIIFQAVVRGEG